MADSAQQPRHPATKRRLQQARREGRIARSSELAGLAVMAAATAGIVWLTPDAASELVLMSRELWQFDAAAATDDQSVRPTVLRAGFALTEAVGPILFLLLGAGLVGRGFFGGWVWSATPLVPRLARLSPTDAVERLFGAAAWLCMGLQAAKAILLFAVAMWLAWTLAPALPSLMSGAVGDLPNALLALWSPAGGALVAAAASVALVDMGLQYWLHRRSLRMTDEELREEARQAGVDPQIKQRLRAAVGAPAADTTVPAKPAAMTGLMINAEALVIASAGENALPTLAVLVRRDGDGRLAIAVVATRMERVRSLVAQVRDAGVPVVSHRGLAMALAHRAAGKSGRPLPPSLADALGRLLKAPQVATQSVRGQDMTDAVRQAGATGRQATGVDMEVPRI